MHTANLIFCIQYKDLTEQEGLVDTEGQKVNFVEGSAIKKLVDEFNKDKMEERNVETLRSRVDNDTWKLCAELFLVQTVDKSVLKANELTKELTSYVTIWDEAFALLTVESNMKLWLVQVAGIPIDRKKNMERYVVTGKAAKGKNVRLGWTLEGHSGSNVELLILIKSPFIAKKSPFSPFIAQKSPFSPMKAT